MLDELPDGTGLFGNIVQVEYSNFSLNRNPKSLSDFLHDGSESSWLMINICNFVDIECRILKMTS